MAWSGCRIRSRLPAHANTNTINAAIRIQYPTNRRRQWEAATGSDVNYVNFNFDPTDLNGACESDVGMAGSPQTIGGAVNCTTTTIMHEMGHALGLFHEQSRADRDTYVNYMEQNIDKPNTAISTSYGSDSVDSGLYNYASIMEYGPFNFEGMGYRRRSKQFRPAWCWAPPSAAIHDRRPGRNHAPVRASRRVPSPWTRIPLD